MQLLVFLSLFVCCALSQTSIGSGLQLSGKALVEFKHYKTVCNSVSGSVSVDAAVSAKVAALKASLAAGGAEALALNAYLVTVLNGKVSVLATAFADAHVAAKAELDASAQFVATIGSGTKSLALDASADVVASAGAVLERVKARAAVLLRLQATAGLEIDLFTKQYFALLCQEAQAFINAQTGAAFDALKVKIAAGTVVVGDLSVDVLAAVAAKVELLELFAQVKASIDVLAELKAKLVDLPRAIVVDADLKAKATAVTAAEAVADIKLKARTFFAAKAAKAIHVFGDLLAAFGADVDAAVRITLVGRLRDLVIDELGADIAGVTSITITPIKATASLELAVVVSASASANAAALQANLKALVLGFVNAHVHPFKIEVKSLTAAGITVQIFASAQVAGDPVAISITTDDVQAAAQAKFKAAVVAAVQAGVDADLAVVLQTKPGSVLGAIQTAVEASITAIGNAITALDATVKAAVTATLDAFVKVKLNLLDDALVNFNTEVFAVADLQARVKLAAAQVKEAYGVLVLRVKQDLLDLNITGQFVVRLEANLRKQLLLALVDRNGPLNVGVVGCSALTSFDVAADFDEAAIEVLAKTNVECAKYAANYAKILALKRQLLQVIVAKKAHATLEADVKAQVDVVVAKYADLKAKVEAKLAAGFTAKLNAQALVGVWVDAAVQYKTCMKGCLAALGRGAFGASIEVDVQAAAAGTFKHTATATSIDLAASVKAEVEVKLAAYLPICIAQCTGGDATYCKEKPKVESTKRAANSATASQVTSTDSQQTTTSAATPVVISVLSVVFVAIAHYFM